MQRRFQLCVIALLLLTACGAASSPAPTATTASTQTQAILAASALAVGPNRLPIGILLDGTPINDPQAKVHLRFFYLDGTDEQKTQVAGETDATYFGRNLPLAVYVAYPTLLNAGAWGVEVQTTLPGQQPSVSRLRIDVLAEDPTPALGSAAIPVDTPTVSTTDDIAKITSDPQPDPALYQLSIADALKQDKPFAILFGTPGFCKTATCGPSIAVMKQLQQDYGDQMNFIHVETYQYPFAESVVADPPRIVAAMDAWHLQSEPWVFFVGKDGTIRAKFEGGITMDELEPAVQEMIKQG